MLTLFSIGLSLLSSNTTGSNTAARRELQRAEGRRILSRLAGRPITDNDIAREENGRPYFPDCETDFNISHSGAVTAVSLVNGKALRIGCDVQLVQTRANTKRIAEEFFSASEREYIEHDETRFFEIWVLKESYLKLRGLSVFDIARAPSFAMNSEQLAMSSGGLQFYLYELTGKADERYMLAAAIEGTSQAPVIRWFSEDRLLCRGIDEVYNRQGV